MFTKFYVVYVDKFANKQKLENVSVVPMLCHIYKKGSYYGIFHLKSSVFPHKFFHRKKIWVEFKMADGVIYKSFGLAL